jgi:predicted MPP superfamily phosphohydrolase
MNARISRRDVLRRGALGLAVAAGGGIAVGTAERLSLVLNRVDVPLAGLPRDLDAFTIAHLSDLHRGRWVEEAFLRDAAALAMSARPQMIALTGDFLSESMRYMPSAAAALTSLRAPYGVFAVLGNHDYWAGDAAGVVRSLRAAGVDVLVNQGVARRVRGAALWVCGVDDWWGGFPDIGRAVAAAPDGAVRILLAHEPDLADQAAEAAIPLQLSGHSHGGQVRLPGLGPIALPRYGRKYPLGLQRVERGETLVFTTTGVGVVYVPFRLNCRPEVALLTLRAA